MTVHVLETHMSGHRFTRGLLGICSLIWWMFHVSAALGGQRNIQSPFRNKSCKFEQMNISKCLDSVDRSSCSCIRDDVLCTKLQLVVWRSLCACGIYRWTNYGFEWPSECDLDCYAHDNPNLCMAVRLYGPCYFHWVNVEVMMEGGIEWIESNFPSGLKSMLSKIQIEVRILVWKWRFDENWLKLFH